MLDGNDGSVEERPVFFYRGNLLYAVRMNQYKVWIVGTVSQLNISRHTFSLGQLVKKS